MVVALAEHLVLHTCIRHRRAEVVLRPDDGRDLPAELDSLLARLDRDLELGFLVLLDPEPVARAGRPLAVELDPDAVHAQRRLLLQLERAGHAFELVGRERLCIDVFAFWVSDLYPHAAHAALVILALQQIAPPDLEVHGLFGTVHGSIRKAIGPQHGRRAGPPVVMAPEADTVERHPAVLRLGHHDCLREGLAQTLRLVLNNSHLVGLELTAP